MPTDYFAGMRQILLGVKAVLLNYRGTAAGDFLGAVTTYKIGVMSPMTVYPAIVILPDGEAIERWYSGRCAMMSRSVSIFTYVKDIDFKKAQKLSSYLCEKTVDLLQKAFTLETQDSGYKLAFDLDVDFVNFEVASGSDVLAACTTTLTFRSKEQVDVATDKSKVLINSPLTSDLADLIAERLVAELKSVKTVIRGGVSETVVTHFPAVLVKEVGKRSIKYESGRNREPRSFIVSVCTKQVPDDRLLFVLIGIVEEVKKVLHKYETWGGRAIQSELGRIEYGQATSGEQYVYVADIPYEVDSVRETVFL